MVLAESNVPATKRVDQILIPGKYYPLIRFSAKVQQIKKVCIVLHFHEGKRQYTHIGDSPKLFVELTLHP